MARGPIFLNRHHYHPTFPRHFNPSVFTPWVFFSVFSYPIQKRVARRDPNRRLVLMREKEKGGERWIDRTGRGGCGGRGGRRNCSAFARLFQQAVTATVQPPPQLSLSLSLLPPFLTLSPVFDVRSKAAVIFFSPLPPPPPLPVSLSGGKERGSAKCHVVVLGQVCRVMWRHF